MMNNDGIGCCQAFVAIATQQIQQQTEFYSQVFALLPQPSTPTYSEFALPSLRLGIFVPNPDNVAEFSQAAKSPVSLCLEIHDLDQAIAHLKALGHPPAGPVMHTSHGREVYVYDPDGNRLILHQA